MNAEKRKREFKKCVSLPIWSCPEPENQEACSIHPRTPRLPQHAFHRRKKKKKKKKKKRR
jgi:hypothetical protein